jgi:hypothetical protein
LPRNAEPAGQVCLGPALLRSQHSKTVLHHAAFGAKLANAGS